MESYPKIFIIKKGEQKSETAEMPSARSLIITHINSEKEIISLYLERGEDSYGYTEKRFIGYKRRTIQYLKNGITMYFQYFFAYNNSEGTRDLIIKVEII